MNRYRLTLLIPLLLSLAACAALTDRSTPPTGTADDGADLAARCEAVNQALVASRGIGQLAFTRSGRTQRLKFAWVSRLPDKLRVVLLGLDGRPLVTTAADGRVIRLMDHTTGKFHRESYPGGRLKAMLDLPLTLDSLARLLAGRMPVFDYDRAEPTEGRTPVEDGIILKKRWNRVGRLYLHVSQPVFTRIEVYRQTGELRYRIDIEETRQIKAFRVPRRLSIDAGGARRLTLDIERYWANEPVNPKTFRLAPPE